MNEIRVIAACENYTELTLANLPRLLVRRTMRGWLALLPAAQFVRVHRGLLVNLDQVGRVERMTSELTKLHFVGERLAPVEIKRRHWPSLRGKLETWRTSRRQTSVPASDSSRIALAVLPFKNSGGAPSDDLFCEGLSEELLNVLSKSPLLRVAARTSAFSFRGRKVPIADIARQLGVDFIVEGSVRKSRSGARITTRLIAASDGFQTWSETIERELTSLLDIEDEIAGVIAEQLKIKLQPATRLAPAVNPDAHRLALEGRHFWNLRTPDGLTRAEKAFVAALALDPDFPRALAGLADVCVVRAMYRLAEGEATANDDLTRARTAAERALQLDATLAEPHTTLGFVRFHEGSPAEAEPHLARGIAINPSYATGHQFYAWTLAALGRLDEALDVYARAIRIDPLSFINLDRYAAMLFLAGRFADALAASERAAALRPDLFVGNLSQRAPILLALGRRDEALAVARSVRRMAPGVSFRRNSDADAIFVLRQCGLAAEADDYGTELLSGLSESNHLRGFVLAALGRFHEARPSLRHTPTIMLPFLYWSPLWNEAREQPAFLELITALGRTREYFQARAAIQNPASLP